MTQLAEVEATYFDVLLNACQSLGLAAKALAEAHKEVVKPPRPRCLAICTHLSWPYVTPLDTFFQDPGRAHFDTLLDEVKYPHRAPSRRLLTLHREADCREAVNCIIGSCQLRPREIYRALRRLQVACIWCQDRKAGVEREIDEIFRQQARWHALMTREHHFLELGGPRQP